MNVPKQPVYLDYAASTPVSDVVFRAMKPYFSTQYANPSALHTKGQNARGAIDKARADIAELLSCAPQEIIFTSGATESVNTIIHSAVMTGEKTNKRAHIITTEIEHSSTLIACAEARENGAEVDYIKPEKNGIIDPKKIQEKIRENTVLVSVMFVNNEIGTIQPIGAIGEILKNNPNIIFHTDAVQAGYHYELKPRDLNADAMTLSSHKIYGPKGAGLLYIKDKTPFRPLILGGSQEDKRRGGTENTPAIVGFATALKEAKKTREKEGARQKRLRDILIDGLLKNKNIDLNGSREQRVANNVNIEIKGIPANAFIPYLDDKKIQISGGSACDSGAPLPSHVVLAIGKNSSQAKSSARITLGAQTKEKDILYVIETINNMTEELKTA